MAETQLKKHLAGIEGVELLGGDTFVREHYPHECEHMVNIQLNMQMNMRQVYRSMAAYFDRDDVSLPGAARFFKACSDRALRDAYAFLDYQNLRGGRVLLKSVAAPECDFRHPDKGDALCAFECALALEKLCLQRLREAHSAAEQHNDPEMRDFINSKVHEEMLHARELSTYVGQLRRVGRGHGVFHFDKRVEGRHGKVLSAALNMPVAPA